MPVLSPIAWGQHCVVVFPALYLLTRAWVCGDLRSPVMRLILIAIAFLFIFTSRFFLGKELSLLLESYHLIPVAMLLLCGLTLVAGQKLESAREQERTMA